MAPMMVTTTTMTMTMTTTTMMMTMRAEQPSGSGVEARAGRLLIVEDDVQLAALLQEQLTIAGYAVTHAQRLADARRRLATEPYDLVVLDRNLPDGDGLELAEQLAGERAGQGVQGPDVLVLTAAADVSSRITGLYAGASDYLTKPFNVQELLARVYVRLRERRAGRDLRVGELELVPATNSCKVGDVVASLPEREFAVLHTLVKYRGRVLAQDDLARAVYGAGTPDSNTIEVFVYNLRRKLRQLGLNDVIRTVRNRGYVIL